MTYLRPPSSDTVEAKFLILFLSTSIPDSSEPFTSNDVALILSGGPGVGKTTVAKAMLDEIGATSLFINGSEESGIDVLRNKIKNFLNESAFKMCKGVKDAR
jgi:DNA polymerase III delta prime subunit